MLAIALELAKEDPAYEDVASKFFEHFVNIAHAMNDMGRDSVSLWDAEDGFYYDVLRLPHGEQHFLKIRSMVGLIPLFAVETLEPEIVDRLPGFKRRMQWFVDNHPDVPEHIEMTQRSARGVRRLLSLVNRKQLKRVLARMLDETEFLSPYGIRALSRYHLDHPYELSVNGHVNRVDYEPAESTTGLFGGNSNWRGPIWFPVNYLLIESLQKFHHYYGEDFKVECPAHSQREADLWQVAADWEARNGNPFFRQGCSCRRRNRRARPCGEPGFLRRRRGGNRHLSPGERVRGPQKRERRKLRAIGRPPCRRHGRVCRARIGGCDHGEIRPAGYSRQRDRRLHRRHQALGTRTESA